MFPRLLLLLVTLAILVSGAERVVPVQDLMPATERLDGQGGTLRMRIVAHQGSSRTLRLIEHRTADGAVDSRTMVADHLLVALQGSPTPAEVQALATAQGCTVRRRLGLSQTWLLAFPVRDPEAPDRMRDRLAALPQVRRVEPDWQITSTVIPDDPDFPRQWSLNNLYEDGSPTGHDIKAPAAWKTTTGSRGVVVGIIDTGIAYDHPDLAANVWMNPGETGLDANGRDKRTNGIDDDGNGYVDDWRGWNFVAGSNDPQDDNGHGSHCAGIIGATGNDGKGITGVCWQVSLLGLKFLDAYGSGYTADAVEAVLYADRLGIPITSNSWGSSVPSESLQEAMTAAASHGMLVVVAAGNTGRDLGRQPAYPAAFPIANLINVAATNRWDQLSYFSAFSATAVHIAAPGEDIYSTVLEGHESHSGTSMATPHVAGVAALIKAARPGITAGQLKAVLIDGVEPRSKLANATVSGGRLDAARSLDLATGAWLRATDWSISDQNDNGVVEPGEWCEIRVFLRNDGLVASPEATFGIELMGTDPAIESLGGTVAVPSLAPGSSQSTSRVRIAVAADAAAPHEVLVRAVIGYGGGQQVRKPIRIAISRANILQGVVRRMQDGSPVPAAQVIARGSADRSVITDADGTYSMVLPDGDITVEARIIGQLNGAPRTLHLPPGQILDLQVGAPRVVVTPPSATVVQGARVALRLPIANTGDMPLHWTIEVDPEFSVEGLWHRTLRRSQDGAPVWWYGQEETGNFATGAVTRGSLTLPVVEVPAAGGALDFWSWRSTEPAFPEFTDTCTVELSTDAGATWTQTLTEIRDSNWSSTWTTYHLPLDTWAGKTVRMRFSFDSVDAFVNEGEGWYVGSIVACGRRLEPRGWAVPSSGTVLAGTSDPVQVTIDTIGLASGNQNVPIQLRSDDPAARVTTVQIPLTITPAAVPVLLGTTIREVAGDGDGWFEQGETIGIDLEYQNPGDLPVDLSASLESIQGNLQFLTATVSGTIPAHGRQVLTGIQLRVGEHSYSYDEEQSGSILVSDGVNSWRLPISVTVSHRNTVRGQVVDAGGRALAGVRIDVADRWRYPVASKVSGADGRFDLPGLFQSTYILKANLPGLSPETRTLQVDTDQTIRITLGQRRLRVDTIRLDGVVDDGGQKTVLLSLAATGDVPVTCRILSSAVIADYLVETSEDVDGPVYAWATLPDSSTMLPVTSATQGNLPVGFPFPFYGASYGTFQFSGAGWLSFIDGHDQSYGEWDAPPYHELPRSLIAPWMGYLYGDSTRTRYRMSGGADRLTLESSHMMDLLGTEVSHQTVLTPDGTITVHYQQVGSSPYVIAGIQNTAASKGVGIYGAYGVSPMMNPAWKPRSGTSVRYRPAARIVGLPQDLVPDPDGGQLLTIAPGAGIQLPVVLSAAGLPAGIHRDRLVILSDVLDHPWVSVPVALTVTGSGTHPAPPVESSGGSSKGCGVGSGLAAILMTVGGLLGLRRIRNPRVHGPGKEVLSGGG